MFTALIMGGLVAAGVIILAHKLGIRKIAGHDVAADVAISAGLMILFAGTISGLMTGAIAGIIVSLYLMAIHKYASVEKLTITKDNWLPHWEPVPLIR